MDRDKYLDQVTGSTRLPRRGSRITVVLLLAVVAIVALLVWLVF